MRILNLEIKNSAVKIEALKNPNTGCCETCDDEGDFCFLEISLRETLNDVALNFRAFVGTFCAEKYLRMLAQ